jgi:selenium metabolism protein YedF
MLIDARGQGCPKPVMMVDEALSGMKEGIVEVLVDNEESSLNVEGYARQNGLFSETLRVGKDWKVKIVKGYGSNANAECGLRIADLGDKKQLQNESEILHAEPGDKKQLLLIISTDALGKDEELGKKLVKGFFDTMKVTKQLPHTIFFLNAGVKLTTVNDETVGVLKEIEAMGVEMYSCGTCLKHYDLESMLKVGHRGTTNHIVEGMQDFDKVVWI